MRGLWKKAGKFQVQKLRLLVGERRLERGNIGSISAMVGPCNTPAVGRKAHRSFLENTRVGVVKGQ